MLAKRLDKRVTTRAMITEHFLDIIPIDITEDEERHIVPIVSFADTVTLKQVPRLVRKLASKLHYNYIVFCPPSKVRPQLVYKTKEDLFLQFSSKKGFVTAECVDVHIWLEQNQKKERRGKNV
jgi:hypothetical protein